MKTSEYSGITKFSVEVLPPYSSKFDIGDVFRSNANSIPRNRIVLRKRGTNVTKQMSYARYVFICDQYARIGIDTIPEGMEIDHINDNSLDDRIANLQLLTRLENIRKRDYKLYRNSFIDDRMLSDIRMYLDNGWLRREVVKVLNIPMGYLRYLIMNFIPDYSSPEFIERNLDDIKNKLELGSTQEEIADEYGVHQATISRIVQQHFPELNKATLIEDRVSFIKEHLAQDLSLSEIARRLSIDTSLVLYYIRVKKIAEYDAWSKRQSSSKEGLYALFEQGYELVKSGLTFNAAALQVGVQPKSLTAYVRRVYPDSTVSLTPKAVVTEETKEAVKEAIREGRLSGIAIVGKYNVSAAYVTKMRKIVDDEKIK